MMTIGDSKVDAPTAEFGADGATKRSRSTREAIDEALQAWRCAE